MNYWWVSDQHLNHKNIIKYCNRPFKSLDHMNDTIVRNHNSRVKDGDIVYSIGDFCFRNSPGGKEGEGLSIQSIELEKLLKGKMIFICGNHDKSNSTKTNIYNIKIKYGGKLINMVHNPEHCDYNVDINLTGHVHEHWQIKRFQTYTSFTDCINVGVDVWNFMPVSFNELMSRYSKWKKKNGYR